MIHRNTTPAFFPYVFCMTTYFIMIFLNDNKILEYLKLQDTSFTEYDSINFYKIIGALFSSIVIIFMQKFAFRKLLIISLILYLISVFNIVIVDVSFNVQLMYFILYNANIIIIFSVLFSYIIIDKKISVDNSIALIASCALFSYILCQILQYFSIFPEIILSNIFLSIIFISLLFLFYKKEMLIHNSRFFSVIKHVEIETLIGFTIFYLIMVIQDGYDVYALIESLDVFQAHQKIYAKLLSNISAIIFTIFFAPKIDKHKLNIINIIILIFMIMSIGFWDKYVITSFIGRIITTIGLYTIFASSIILLTKKFQGINLFNALSIYLLGSSFGYYCGYITINTSEDTIGVNGFLISISFVLIGLLIYYLYFFNRNKLYR